MTLPRKNSQKIWHFLGIFQENRAFSRKFLGSRNTDDISQENLGIPRNLQEFQALFPVNFCLFPEIPRKIQDSQKDLGFLCRISSEELGFLGFLEKIPRKILEISRNSQKNVYFSGREEELLEMSQNACSNSQKNGWFSRNSQKHVYSKERTGTCIPRKFQDSQNFLGIPRKTCISQAQKNNCQKNPRMAPLIPRKWLIFQEFLETRVFQIKSWYLHSQKVLGSYALRETESLVPCFPRKVQKLLVRT